MIEKLLNKLGYIKARDIPEEILLLEIGKIVGNVNEYVIDPEQEKELFSILARVDGLQDYLKATMARDMQRDFSSPKEQSQLIHGAFARTAYLRGRLMETKKEAIDEKSQLSSLRYG